MYLHIPPLRAQLARVYLEPVRFPVPPRSLAPAEPRYYLIPVLALHHAANTHGIGEIRLRDELTLF